MAGGIEVFPSPAAEPPAISPYGVYALTPLDGESVFACASLAENIVLSWEVARRMSVLLASNPATRECLTICLVLRLAMSNVKSQDFFFATEKMDLALFCADAANDPPYDL
jgi:aspartate oxidase